MSSCFVTECPERDLAVANMTMRRCRRACDPENPVCNPPLSCRCGNECGYSCVRLSNVKFVKSLPPTL